MGNLRRAGGREIPRKEIAREPRNRFERFPAEQALQRVWLRDFSGDARHERIDERCAGVIVIEHLAGLAQVERCAPEPHAVDPQRGENLLLDEIGERLAGNVLDDAAEDEETEIGIGEAGARIKIERGVQHVGNDCSRRRGERDADGGGDSLAKRSDDRVAADRGIPAAGVRKQVADGDEREARVAEADRTRRDVGENAERFVVERKLTSFDQLHHGNGGDGLADAAEAEKGFGRRFAGGSGSHRAGNVPSVPRFPLSPGFPAQVSRRFPQVSQVSQVSGVV